MACQCSGPLLSRGFALSSTPRHISPRMVQAKKRRSFMVTDILDDQSDDPTYPRETVHPSSMNDNQQICTAQCYQPSPPHLESEMQSTPRCDSAFHPSEDDENMSSPSFEPNNLSQSDPHTPEDHNCSVTEPQKSLSGSPTGSVRNTNTRDSDHSYEKSLGRSGARSSRFVPFSDRIKGPRKLRKARTAFTDQQLNELEHSFDKQKYLAVQDRMDLANRLGLSDMQVKTWYQNRRTKWKRQTAVGLELLAEADNFAAVQRLLQHSSYWAYHSTSKGIFSDKEHTNGIDGHADCLSGRHEDMPTKYDAAAVGNEIDGNGSKRWTTSKNSTAHSQPSVLSDKSAGLLQVPTGCNSETRRLPPSGIGELRISPLGISHPIPFITPNFLSNTEDASMQHVSNSNDILWLSYALSHMKPRVNPVDPLNFSNQNN
ncbi:unnamed protein product [Calicophoron daubneyi]|uniref:Homeobox domain-containing protein n=1 Tax=Calicophoron daubneyi TaxID=300641 RepID=A0AAV2TFB3_CALDB